MNINTKPTNWAMQAAEKINDTEPDELIVGQPEVDGGEYGPMWSDRQYSLWWAHIIRKHAGEEEVTGLLQEMLDANDDICIGCGQEMIHDAGCPFFRARAYLRARGGK